MLGLRNSKSKHQGEPVSEFHFGPTVRGYGELACLCSSVPKQPRKSGVGRGWGSFLANTARKRILCEPHLFPPLPHPPIHVCAVSEVLGQEDLGILAAVSPGMAYAFPTPMYYHLSPQTTGQMGPAFSAGPGTSE